MNEVFQQLNDFLLSNQRNEWLACTTFKVFVRKSIRFYNGESFRCLDLASIEVEEEWQNKGIFTTFLTLLLSTYPELNIFVESILHPAVTHILKKFKFEFYRLYEHQQVDMILIQEKN